MRPGFEKRVDLGARRRIAEELLGGIRWQTDVRGYCVCPGVAAHTNGNGKRDCRVELAADEVPTVHCFHKSCLPDVEAANARLRSLIGKAETFRVSATGGPSGGNRVYQLRRPVPAAQRAKSEIREVRWGQTGISDKTDGVR